MELSEACQDEPRLRPGVLGVGDGAVLERRQLPLVGMAMGMVVRIERSRHARSASTTFSTSVRIMPSYVSAGASPSESV